jgi:hypothetical protein
MVFVICWARSPHALQVLHSGSNGGMGETSGAEAGDDDERSKRAVMKTLNPNQQAASPTKFIGKKRWQCSFRTAVTEGNNRIEVLQMPASKLSLWMKRARSPFLAASRA